MEKLYYTIGEAAGILGESTSLVRFWSNSFPKYIKPKRNAKGNRLFTEEDLECLKQIHLLVKEQGLTLEGAAKKIAADRKAVEGRVKALDSLKEIRRQLVEVKKIFIGMTVKDIASVIESFAPLSIQESWDNSGLVIGSEAQEVHGVLLGFDCTADLVDEAVSLGADMIITHHPLIFSGLKRFPLTILSGWR